jgi:uncharacterized protein YebE (UPF0316 family)
MDLAFLTGDSFIFTWVILPLLIFLSRIADQSIGTLRLILLSKGYKLLAPTLGFFEVIIWLAAVGQIFQQLDNFLYYLAYGLGFAAGNFVGMLLEEKLSLGNVVVRIIPKKETTSLVKHLSDEAYGLTRVAAEGVRGPVEILFTIIPRKRLNNLISIINQYNPNAFYSVEDVKMVKHGILEPITPIKNKPHSPQFWRKSK